MTYTNIDQTKTEPSVSVTKLGAKGRGLVSNCEFLAEEVILRSDVTEISKSDSQLISGTDMSEFLVRWKNGPNREVVTYALLNSPATFCNHSVEPNAALVRDVDRHICELVAIHEIAAGDEITISYYNPDESYKNSV